MALIPIAAGIPVLLFGRKLYWFLIGALGFVLGLGIAEFILPDSRGWTPVIIALALGLVGTLLAMLLQKFTLSIVGFIGGGIIGLSLLNMLALDGNGAKIIAFILGAVIGAGLVFIIFDYALIIISTIAGSLMITQGAIKFFEIQEGLRLIIFAALLILGFMMQLNQKNKET